jgi:hypothetical protein
VVCAVNLQHTARHLRRSWFLIAMDSAAAHQSTSYLDFMFPSFNLFSNIVNLHGCALPMFDQRTCEVMFTTVSTFLNVLCPNWNICLVLSVTSDGARKMMGCDAGVVSHLDNAMHDACHLTRIGCGAHQLDLMMEDIMSNIVKERFFSVKSTTDHGTSTRY